MGQSHISRSVPTYLYPFASAVCFERNDARISTRGQVPRLEIALIARPTASVFQDCTAAFASCMAMLIKALTLGIGCCRQLFSNSQVGRKAAFSTQHSGPFHAF